MSTDGPGKPARRRWIPIGESVAVAGVVISALGLYNGWHGDEKTASPSASRPADIPSLLLKATADPSGDRLTLEPTKPAIVIQTETISFPKALAVAPVETAGTPEIEADWLTKGLQKARRAAARPEETDRQELLPVLITTRYAAGEAIAEDRAIYDIGFTVDSSFLGGSHVRLRGLSLQARRVGENGQHRIDALWAARNPVKK